MNQSTPIFIRSTDNQPKATPGLPCQQQQARKATPQSINQPTNNQFIQFIMFKHTREHLKKTWEEGKIYRDPAPMPFEGLSELVKALYKDVKEIFSPDQDRLINKY